MCHNCGALERHRLLWLYLTRRLQIFDHPRKLLHFAPEPVLYRKFMDADRIEYYPCDLAPQNLPADVRAMDITDIQFDDESFDAIVCNHVLEHVPDDHKAMSELCRVLRTGGWAILQVPISSDLEQTIEDPAVTDPGERRKLYGQSDHVRRYGRNLDKRLERAGFDVKVEEIEQLFSPQEAERFGLMADEVVYFCTKGDTTQ
jgi:SAM-dependent methyltransferase